MVRTGVALMALAIGMSAGMAGAAHAQTSCEQLKGFTAPDVQVTAAAPATSPVPLCKLDGVIGKEINFTVWLPDTWNGKFVMGGQGGFAGRVESQVMGMNALQRGYAIAGTDTGHKGPAGATDGAWAMGDLERIVNYAHAAIHRVTQTSKAVMQTRYGKMPDRSYFAGCSNGGRAALMAAQRYPDDFDGIIAGAPAIDFQGVTATFASVTQKMYPDPKKLDEPVLGKASRDLISKSVLEKCDNLDGLNDGVLGDPRQCKFDVKTLTCKGKKTDACLSAPEIAAVDAILKGPMVKGKPVAVGFPYGGEYGEGGWGSWLAGRKDGAGAGRPSLAYGFSTDFMRYFVKQDPAWNHTQLDLAALPEDMKAVQATLSPTNPDLSAFRNSGGKLLMYHGWSDSALSPYMSLNYLDKVYAHDATAKNDVRLFMLPGVMHCAGGPGPDRVDYIDALDKWVSGGQAPEELTAGFGGGGARKVCAWPKQAVFKGTGDGKSPDQFECK